MCGHVEGGTSFPSPHEHGIKYKASPCIQTPPTCTSTPLLNLDIGWKGRNRRRLEENDWKETEMYKERNRRQVRSGDLTSKRTLKRSEQIQRARLRVRPVLGKPRTPLQTCWNEWFLLEGITMASLLSLKWGTMREQDSAKRSFQLLGWWELFGKIRWTRIAKMADFGDAFS